jgi:hypothetical protein
MSEKDLLVPAGLLEPQPGHQPIVVINIPLARPSSDRLWLSDGSLPLNKTVSPPGLIKESEFAEYVPRAVSDLADINGSINALVHQFLEVETKRLACARVLYQREWSKFLYRISVFDHLSHLIGLNYLRARDLSVFAEIQKFLQRLDAFFEAVIGDDRVRLTLISGYSHIGCRAMVNLDDLLAEGEFLVPENNLSPEADMTRRQDAMSTVMGTPRLYPTLMASMEGRLNTSATVAASPVAGCIFINKKDAFKDGCVEPGAVADVCRRVSAYLRNRFSRVYGSGFELEERPAGSTDVAQVPEFVVHIEGVEFHNMTGMGSWGYNVPRTTHSRSGFTLLPKGLSADENLTLTQLTGLMNDARSSRESART